MYINYQMTPEETDYYAYLSYFGGEEYIALPGYEGYYEISNLGNIRSLDRVQAHPKTEDGIYIKRGKRLKLNSLPKGYKTITLTVDKPRTFLVHRLVAQAFIGECPKGLDVCHNNGSNTDNALCNLRFDTRKNNLKDQERHGTKISGSQIPWSILTEEQVIEIRGLLNEGVRQRVIAKQFGVKTSLIEAIAEERTWKGVGPKILSKQEKIAKGGKNGNAIKLTVEKIRQIKQLISKGKPNIHIAKQFGVAQPTISGIKTGRYWKEVS